MKIQLERKGKFDLILVVETKNVATHSALSDLTPDEKLMIKADLNYLLNMMEDLMERRRFELSKGKG
jgi:hypothetical protein